MRRLNTSHGPRAPRPEASPGSPAAIKLPCPYPIFMAMDLSARATVKR
jgi:hypothetical protein